LRENAAAVTGSRCGGVARRRSVDHRRVSDTGAAEPPPTAATATCPSADAPSSRPPVGEKASADTGDASSATVVTTV